MRDDLEKAMMEIGEPFSKEEIADMMAIACDPETKRINYEHYINLLIVCVILDTYERVNFLLQKLLSSIKTRSLTEPLTTTPSRKYQRNAMYTLLSMQWMLLN